MAERDPRTSPAIATRDDIESTLGEMDTEKLMAILALGPSVADVQQAAVWLAGDADVLSGRSLLKGAAGEIVTILTADEEEEPRG